MKKKSIKAIKILILILILTLNVALAISLSVNKIANNTFTAGLFSSEFDGKYSKLLDKTWNKIKDYYIEQEKINPDKAAFEAIRGVIKSLGDPYSDIYTPKQAKIFDEDMEGKFCGIGAEIGIRNNLPTIIAPLEKSPAEKNGLKPGDVILKINDEDTSNMSLEEAVFKIRGDCGKKVKLTIFREKWNNPKDFIIKREEIKIKAVTYKIIENNIGYVKINTFSKTTQYELENAMKFLSKNNIKKLIIDLRNNPGGFLDSAIKVSEMFVPKGSIILKELWGKEKREKQVVSKKEKIFSYPKNNVIILVNKGTASAAEIFAAALRHNLGYKLMGEKTFGKGTVQQIFNIDDYMLKLTVAYWLTPDGKKLEGNGLEPDYKIEIDYNNENNKNKDIVLEEAIKILNK
jgi:carboxyl-terminal processing protease